MPRVPITGPQVDRAGLPAGMIDYRPSPRDFGADVAAGAADVGGVLSQIDRENKDRSDQVAAQDAINRAKAVQIALMRAGDFTSTAIFAAALPSLSRSSSVRPAVSSRYASSMAFWSM